MAWTLYDVPSAKKSDVETALKDDVVSRQSHTIRDAGAMGGPSGALYVLVEGSADGVRRADELLGPVGKKVPAAESEPLYKKFQEEREAASSGMGLFFTEE